MAKVYENTGGAFSEVPAAGLTGVYDSSVAWGDYDNDGDLDILLTGYASGGPVAKVYENTGGAFSEVPAGLTGVSTPRSPGGTTTTTATSTSCSPDGIRDPTAVAKVYRNEVSTANAPPSAPANLSVSLTDTTATFTWDPASDAETPASGLSYNLWVSVPPATVVSPMADLSSGCRRAVELGNVNGNTT